MGTLRLLTLLALLVTLPGYSLAAFAQCLGAGKQMSTGEDSMAQDFCSAKADGKAECQNDMDTDRQHGHTCKIRKSGCCTTTAQLAALVGASLLWAVRTPSSTAPMPVPVPLDESSGPWRPPPSDLTFRAASKLHSSVHL